MIRVAHELTAPFTRVRPVCAACSNAAERVAVLSIGRLEPFKLCMPCVRVLRECLPRNRGPRPLSSKARRVLAWLAQTPAACGSLAEIGAATGGYATNVVRTLLNRGMVQRVPAVDATFAITPRGLEEIQP